MEELTSLRAEFLVGAKHTLSADEVRLISLMIVGNDVVTRWMLLDIYDNNGYSSVHLSTFDEYCRDYLRMEYSRAYYYHLVSAARVERLLFGPQTIQQLTSKDFPKTPIQDLLKLAQIPEASLEKAWKEYCSVRDSVAVSPGQTVRTLKKIVKREENMTAPPPVPIETPSDPRRAETAQTDRVDPFAEQEEEKPKRPAVSSFTPPPDPEPTASDIISEEMDWEKAGWIMELVSSWVKVKGYNGRKSSLCEAAEMLHRIAEWIEVGTL